MTEQYAPSRARYRPEIDGLRGIAVLLVVGYHAGFPGFGGGFLGVDIFFVISGYLITGLLARELEVTGRISWRSFYARRARRLVPAFIAMLLGVSLLSLIALNPLGDQQAFAKSAIAATASAANIFFWRYAQADYFAAPITGHPLLHTWSLAVEEQFYVALQIVILLVIWTAGKSRCSIARLLLGAAVGGTAISFAVAVWWAANHTSAAFYTPISRAFEFGIGGILALSLWRLKQWSQLLIAMISLPLLALPIVVQRSGDGFDAGWTAALVLGTAGMISVASRAQGIFAAILSARPLVTVGMVSYGWYLWHWPLLVLAASWNLGIPSLKWRIAIVLLAFATALVSHFWIERLFWTPPACPGTPPERNPGKTIVASFAALVMAAGAASAVGWQAVQERQTQFWRTIQARMTDAPTLPASCGASKLLPIGDPLAPCVIRRSDAAEHVVVWGDSHAWHYLPAIEAAASQHEASVTSWTAGGCPPYVGAFETASNTSYPEHLFDLCDQRNSAADSFVRRLLRQGEDVIVVLAARWAPYLGATPISIADRGSGTAAPLIQAFNPRLQSGTPKLVSELSRLGAKFILVNQVPELVRNPVLCEARIGIVNCDSVSRSKSDIYLSDSRTFLEELLAITMAGTGEIMDFSSRMCGPTRCNASTSTQFYYFDDDHLSATFSVTLADDFASVMASLKIASAP